ERATDTEDRQLIVEEGQEPRSGTSVNLVLIRAVHLHAEPLGVLQDTNDSVSDHVNNDRLVIRVGRDALIEVRNPQTQTSLGDVEQVADQSRLLRRQIPSEARR